MSITLTPLSVLPLPPTYLLTVDNAHILLDCGALDRASEATLPSSSSDASTSSPAPTTEQVTAYLARLRALAPTLSLVLLSHPLLSSLGLLPFLRARCGLRCPVYATLPTREMGRYAVEEWADARSAAEANEPRIREKREREGGKAAQGQGQGEGKAGGKRRKGKGKDVTGGEEGAEVKMEGIEGEADGEKKDEDDLADEGEEKDPWDPAWKLTTQEIRDAFLAINAVRWTQPIHLTGPLKGYTLVAHRSGHTLGGSLYTLRPSLSSSLSPASSASSLLYAPLFNHVKEHHLDPTALLNAGNVDDNFRRMGVVVVGAQRSGVVNVKRIDRERKLLDLITATLRSSGSVLLPTDPSARLFELLVLLETHWQFNNLGAQFPLCLISRTGRDATGFVRSLTEWMGGQLAGGGDATERLKFSNLRIFTSLDEISASIPPSVPKLILTVPSTLSYGFARALFLDFARTPQNLVVLTGLSEPGSLARWLAEEVWQKEQEEGGRYGQGQVGKEVQMDRTIELEMKRKVYLAGDELEAYLAAEREAADLLAKQQAALERSRRMLNAGDGDASDSDSDADDGDEAEAEADAAEEAENTVAAPARRRRLGAFTGGAGAWDEFLDADAMAGQAPGAGFGGGAGPGAGGAGARGAQSFDIYVRGGYGVRPGAGTGRDALPRYRMFPVVERKRRVDAYGEQIDVDGWLRRGMEGEEEEAKKEGVLGKREREEEDEEKKVVEEEPPEPPHKYVVDRVEVHLQAQLFVVDMEGLSDGRALKTILPQINPRKLVIVSGTPAAIADLASACKAVTSMTEEVFTPGEGEMVKVGEETKNFSIRLGDSIMQELRLSRVEDYDVAYVSGVIRIDAESDLPILERATIEDAGALPAPVGEVDDSAPAPDAEDVDQSTAAETATPADPSVLPALKPSLFIGDLRLALLKTKLGALSVPSEFTGEGLLVCGPAPPEAFNFDFTAAAARAGVDTRRGQKYVREALMGEAMQASGGRVAVRKVGRGRLVVEGTPGETYFVVRREIYKLHAQAG
ncbi:hypothetical protein JCM10207_002555 [Rhodosporidiobolus poonsookiae]